MTNWNETPETVKAGAEERVSPSDPMVILAGIRQFGLAHDGADLQDLAYAFERNAKEITSLRAEIAHLLELQHERGKAHVEAAAEIARLREAKSVAWEYEICTHVNLATREPEIWSRPQLAFDRPGVGRTIRNIRALVYRDPEPQKGGEQLSSLPTTQPTRATYDAAPLADSKAGGVARLRDVLDSLWRLSFSDRMTKAEALTRLDTINSTAKAALAAADASATEAKDA